ncbi:hypothetical protein [Mucilaginibacter psychrotolerans]|uniref:Uncharacterized protein n=1 Tax=Mucilaginibacter psychrotolerans TaxID=1524096 RepID=A0A4Y8SCD5_9SPHI|nr:hypothetical protein [Mucilaginibacter psychrotolerans]TFF36295.1 hypothetical protein E2R66_15780 [Mucilaginibacter psychrotolerans]
MIRLPYLIALTFLLALSSCKHQNTLAKVDPTWKKIPGSWIAKLQKFGYNKKPDTSLLTAFTRIIKPDTMYNPHA